MSFQFDAFRHDVFHVMFASTDAFQHDVSSADVFQRVLFTMTLFRQKYFHTWHDIIWVCKMCIDPFQLFKRDSVLP